MKSTPSGQTISVTFGHLLFDSLPHNQHSHRLAQRHLQGLVQLSQIEAEQTGGSTDND
jgi:hypothetical protein